MVWVAAVAGGKLNRERWDSGFAAPPPCCAVCRFVKEGDSASFVLQVLVLNISEFVNLITKENGQKI